MQQKSNRVVLFTAKQTAALVEQPFAERPGTGELTARTLVSVVSTGSEIGGYMDYYGGMQYPSPTGYAGVLEVLEVGGDVAGLAPGDRIFAQSPHQLYVKLRAEEALPVPEGMNPEWAVLARFPAVSMTTMIKTAVRPTEPVVVTGLGIIGLTCAAMLRRCGYPVYTVDPDARRRETARACGLENVCASLEDLADLRGSFGLGVECSGNDGATLGLLDVLRRGGELSLVGVPWRSTSPVRVNELFRSVFNGYITLYSGWEWSLPLHAREFLPNSNFGSFAKAMEWIRAGEIPVEGIYSLHSPADCASVYETLSRGQNEKTCAMFDWRGLKG